MKPLHKCRKPPSAARQFSSPKKFDSRSCRRNAAHQRSNAAPPRRLSGDSAAHRSWRLTKTWSQGSMVILAAMGRPSAYPKPESRVTTTLYD